MRSPPAVLFAMKYPDDTGMVWATQEHLSDQVAGRLAGESAALVAFPTLTGNPVVRPTRLRPIEADFYSPAAGDQVAAVCRREGVRVVVYFGGEPADLPLAALQSAGVRTVNLVQDSYPPDARQPPVKWAAKWVLRRLLRRGIHDLYVPNADHQREFLLRYAVLPPDRVRTIRNGVDTDRFRPAPPPDPATLGVPAAERYVVSVCQARPEKRIDLLVRVADEYAGRFPGSPVQFVHVGDGPMLGEWRRLAESGRGRFHFAGARHDVPPFHRLATVYAHCAERESFGLVVAEALACGKPVVATASPGPSEILRGGGGVVVRQDDTDGFVGALARYLGDPELCRRDGQLGRQRVESHFSIARQADELAEAIRGLLPPVSGHASVGGASAG